jgi:protein-L-isoaspartate(D-aspartate) O-methyltransferase
MNLVKEFQKKIIRNQKFISNKNRHELIVELKSKRIINNNILNAIEKIPRELFVNEKFAKFCYENIPLPVACQQTISQPYVIAFMIDCLKLKNTDKVLEIGTGTGYQTALLALLCKHVCTIEIFSRLYNQAKINHDKLKLTNISYMFGNGVNGWNEHDLFDGVIISAATELLPTKLLKSLKNGGRIIFPKKYPVGTQKLIIVKKINETKYKYKTLFDVRFVPLLETNPLESTMQ